jgi:hypothetical protein
MDGLLKLSRPERTYWKDGVLFRTSRRRKPSRQARLTPCECCGFPLSQRHHLAPFAENGETDQTMQLCANCHELYHLIYRVYVEKSEASVQLLGQLLIKNADRSSLFRRVFSFLYPLIADVHDRDRANTLEAIRIVEAARAEKAGPA